MIKHLRRANFALLPIKLDIISRSVVEAMLLELPVITYKTTGTPYLNKDGNTVLLAEIGDIKKLSENMLTLMNKPELVKILRKSAKTFAEKEFNATTCASRLLCNYRAVINHFRRNNLITKELLFDTNEFPIY
jgi:glycosyltransferase involved in cell wall biosynthesis